MIYEPQEDSLLLAKQVKLHAHGRVLDMGTGTGIQALAAAQVSKVKSVLALDKSRRAITYCKQHVTHKKITFKQGDLFQHLAQQQFDTILFNPPYLPSDTYKLDSALIGGKHGWEVIAEFLKKAPDFLAEQGSILLLFSSATKKQKIDEFIAQQLLYGKELAQQHIFFEDLFVYKIMKTEILRELHAEQVTNIEPLAKGKRGIVFKAKWHDRWIAIKLLNPLSKAQHTLQKEASWLKKLNTLKIGPTLYLATPNYIIMNFISGKPIRTWLPRASRKNVVRILRTILAQCHLLDNAGIIKEEMHRPYKHIIISKGVPKLIDFERAHYSQEPKNVTQFCQYIANTSSELTAKEIHITPEKIREAAHAYAHDRKKYKQILALIC